MIAGKSDRPSTATRSFESAPDINPPEITVQRPCPAHPLRRVHRRHRLAAQRQLLTRSSAVGARAQARCRICRANKRTYEGEAQQQPAGTRSALVGVLLLVAGFFLLVDDGRRRRRRSRRRIAARRPPPKWPLVSTADTGGGRRRRAGAGARRRGSRPPPPRPVIAAFEADQTVVLLFVHDGGIDDRMVAADVERLSAIPSVATFVVPASQIARYATITQGVERRPRAGAGRDPAQAPRQRRPHRLGPATASRAPQSVDQAVIDAGYKGRRSPTTHEPWRPETTRATCARSRTRATADRRPALDAAAGAASRA